VTGVNDFFPPREFQLSLITLYPHVVKFFLHRTQAAFNITKTFPIGKLGEGHAHKLV